MTATKFGNKTRSLRTKQSECKFDSFAHSFVEPQQLLNNVFHLVAEMFMWDYLKLSFYLEKCMKYTHFDMDLAELFIFQSYTSTVETWYKEGWCNKIPDIANCFLHSQLNHFALLCLVFDYWYDKISDITNKMSVSLYISDMWSAIPHIPSSIKCALSLLQAKILKLCEFIIISNWMIYSKLCKWKG